MKLLKVALVSVLATGCSSQTPENTLGPCWNVNDLEPGLITGRGVFIRSMHGLSLQAPGCSDQRGGNSFELSRPAELGVREFLIGSSDGHYIGFVFHGYVESVSSGKIIVIEKLSDLRSVQKPKWMIDLEQRSAGAGLTN